MGTINAQLQKYTVCETKAVCETKEYINGDISGAFICTYCNSFFPDLQGIRNHRYRCSNNNPNPSYDWAPLPSWSRSKRYEIWRLNRGLNSSIKVQKYDKKHNAYKTFKHTY